MFVPPPSLRRLQCTILAAAHTCVEVRVVEALCCATEIIIANRGIAAVVSLCLGKTVARLLSLRRVVFETGADSARCIEAIVCALRTITTQARVAPRLGSSATGHFSALGMQLSSETKGSAMTDLLTASAIVCFPSLVCAAAATFSAGDESSGMLVDVAKQAFDVAASTFDESDLALLTAQIVVEEGCNPWALLGTTATRISAEVARLDSHAVKDAGHVLQTICTTTLDSDVLIQVCFD